LIHTRIDLRQADGRAASDLGGLVGLRQDAPGQVGDDHTQERGAQVNTNRPAGVRIELQDDGAAAAAG
jgi:hypothetical protein